MSLPKYEHFKFSVGQFVRSSFCALREQMGSRERLESTYQIVERTYQECPGGVQLHYLCRPSASIWNDKGYVRLNEIELIPMPEEATE